MKVILQEKIPVYMDADEAKLFIKFQENFTLIAHVLGLIERLNIKDFRGATLVLDYDGNGLVNHASATQHYRT